MFVEQVKEKLPYLDWETLMRINRGWSSDKKYKVRALNGKNCLLRLADADRFELKKKEYEIIRKFAALGIPMSRPLAFGLCEKAVFILLSWVEGEDLESVLPNLPEAEQYRLGREAGTILRQLHAIPIYSADLPAGTKIEKNCGNSLPMKRLMFDFRETKRRFASSGRISTRSGGRSPFISTEISIRAT